MAISTGAAILGGAALGLYGSSRQSSAARSAADTQAGAATYAADVQREMFDIINKQQAPYRQAGYSALNRIQTLLPGLTKPVSAAEIQGLPGYQFAMDQGTQAAAMGMNVGGGGSNVQRAAQKFAIDYTLGTAMPQVIAQRQNIYNTLAGVAGIGQTAQGQMTTAGQNFAGNIGQAAIGGASAQAAGQIGAANVMAGGLNQIGNAAFMYSLMNRGTPIAGMSVPINMNIG